MISYAMNKSNTEKNARETIGRMIKKSGKFLQTICSDSGVCIAFGKKSDEITKFFNGFTDFKYAVSPMKKIGNPSANGFVIEIEYERQGYRSHAILKSSQNEKADNLVYECLAGMKFVNRNLKKFPCFVQTYSLYLHDDEDTLEQMKSVNATTDLRILSSLHKEDVGSINYSDACEESEYAAILMQHIDNADALTSFLSSPTFMQNDLLHVLFIIYHALSSLSKQFTHYDLHGGNVLLYEPVKGKYIKYVYHNEDGTTITFKSPYMPKIIDYGRSFFDNGHLNSKKIYEGICKTKECKPACGYNFGFKWLTPNEYLIISSQKNESHDLKLLKILQLKTLHLRKMSSHDEAKETETERQTNNIMNKVVYGVGIENENKKTVGTKEVVHDSSFVNDNKIHNVTDAYIELKTAVEMKSVELENENRYHVIENELGELHVYNNGHPMVFKENKRFIEKEMTNHEEITISPTKTKSMRGGKTKKMKKANKKQQTKRRL